MFCWMEIDRLVAAMRTFGITMLQVEDGDIQLRLEITPERAAPASPTPVQARSVPANSPGIGTFLLRGWDDGLLPLTPGAEVKADEILGYICQGPVRSLVTAPVSGMLATPLPEQETLFGHGDVVFQIEANP